MNFIAKRWKVIMICLVVIILFQTCGGCSKKQQIAFKDVQHEQMKDSLNLIISSQKDSIAILNSKISELQGRNDQLNDANSSLKQASNRPIIIKTNK